MTMTMTMTCAISYLHLKVFSLGEAIQFEDSR